MTFATSVSHVRLSSNYRFSLIRTQHCTAALVPATSKHLKGSAHGMSDLRAQTGNLTAPLEANPSSGTAMSSTADGFVGQLDLHRYLFEWHLPNGRLHWRIDGWVTQTMSTRHRRVADVWLTGTYMQELLRTDSVSSSGESTVPRQERCLFTQTVVARIICIFPSSLCRFRPLFASFAVDTKKPPASNTTY